MSQVHGWLEAFSAEAIRFLAELQNDRGIEGAVGEIGVHHGKLFLILYLSLHRGQRALALDVFGLQQLNVDSSGHGDKDRFLRNVTDHAGSAAHIVLIEDSSLSVTSARLLEACGRFRMLSIDGGHTEECTINDLRLAEEVLAPEGLAILDDVFNEHWPDVGTGLARHLLSGRHHLVPFLITPNKVFLCREEWADEYRKALREGCPSNLYKTAKMFGAVVDIYPRHTPAGPPGCPWDSRAHTRQDPAVAARAGPAPAPLRLASRRVRSVRRTAGSSGWPAGQCSWATRSGPRAALRQRSAPARLPQAPLPSGQPDGDPGRPAGRSLSPDSLNAPMEVDCLKAPTSDPQHRVVGAADARDADAVRPKRLNGQA
jgi:Methyltransferase domain